MERITVEISWEAEDGTLEDLENEGGDVTLAKVALAEVEAGRDTPATRSDVWVNATREEI